MKSFFTVALHLISVIVFGQTKLVIESVDVPFRLAVDGFRVSDSSAFSVEAILPEAGPHLVDIVFNDAGQSVLSRTIRSEANSTVFYSATSGSPGSFLPVYMLRFAVGDSIADTLVYDGIPEFGRLPVVCHFPVSDDSFEQLMNSIKSMEFDFQKETAIKKVMKSSCFSTMQLRLLVSVIEFEDKRLELISSIRSCCTDMESAYKLADLFVFEKSKKQFLESLR